MKTYTIIVLLLFFGLFSQSTYAYYPLPIENKKQVEILFQKAKDSLSYTPIEKRILVWVELQKRIASTRRNTKSEKKFAWIDYFVSMTSKEINRLDKVTNGTPIKSTNAGGNTKNTTNTVPSQANTPTTVYPLAKNINREQVRNTRLQWNNAERKKLGLAAYGYDSRLDQTAQEWSEKSKKNGAITHERKKGDGYYNYKSVNAWFEDRGLVFKIVNGTTNTENIGRGVFKCNKTDCTSDLIAAIKSTFTFYMSEKGKKFSPHYDSIINKQFKIIGLGIAIDEAKGKYYLTVHYGTEIE